MSVVVRFAPSPTGHLHLGGARTALFNWLFGRKAGGTVRLRLEDTDAARSRAEYAISIVESLRWLGLDWDGPVVRQGERAELHRAALERLEAEGRAYRCYCPPEELAKAREMARAAGRTYRYPATCRDKAPRSPDAPYVMRLRVSDGAPPLVEDLLAGSLHGAAAGLDDFVLTRSDGSPLYNISCVVDDSEMGVTHVVRGADHIENTVKQAALYDALGFPRPVFAHLPLVRGLHKRLGSTAVLAFRRQGVLPEALVNYVARLGWSHGDDEVFTPDELLERFDIHAVGRSPGKVNEKKLLWLNQQHMQRASGERLAGIARTIVDEGDPLAGDPRLPAVADLLKPRVRTVAELSEQARVYLGPDEPVAAAAALRLDEMGPEARSRLAELADELELLGRFEQAAVSEALERFREGHGLTLPEVARPCRLALTGSASGPRIVDVIVALGREAVVARFRRAAEAP